MSISIFTLSPGFIEPNPVTEAVCGITFTPNISSFTSFTVNDTPFTATLPFPAMNRANGLGTRNVHRVDAFSAVADTASPTPSTWPETMCPPSSSPIFNDRSRLTWLPTVHPPSVVHAKVSAEASPANPSASTSTAVKQQPEQAIEAPRGIEALSVQG